MKDIDIFIAGLNLTSEQKLFGIMPNILAVADKIILKTSSCNDCNRDAIYTYYDGPKNKTILIGNENYMALCANCLRKRREKNGSQK